MAVKLPRITFKNKKDYQVSDTDEEYLIRAKDMNEIKVTFNESADAIETAVDDVAIAYENMGEYKIENGVVYFKKADGTWNTKGISLAGQSTISLDKTVLNNVTFSTTRRANETNTKVQLQSDDKALMVETLASNVFMDDGTKLTDVLSKQSSIKLNDVVQSELTMSTTRTASPTSMAKVQLKDADGKVIWVETSADQVFLKSTDETSEISQSQLNDKIGELINLVAFYNSSPVSALTELKKYIATIE